MIDLTEVQYERLRSAWKEFQSAYQEAGLGARYAFSKSYPSGKRALVAAGAYEDERYTRAADQSTSTQEQP